jgi:carboxypeptidase Taq
MPARLQQFYAQAHQLFDLTQAQQILEWDQEVIMPAKGLEQRAHQLSALASVIHGKGKDPAYGDLIAALEDSDDLDEWARADVREARRAFDRATKIPARLVEERTEACALAQAAWEVARARNDFGAFQPYLERVVVLTRELAEAIGGDNRYDALLDEFEPGMTEAQLRLVFADLKARLLPLLDALRGASRRPDPSILSRHFPQPGQQAFCLRLVQDMGFDLEAGRCDVSAHPFTNGTMGDVRLTTRYQEDFLPSAIFGTIHEAGHGLYEQGLDAIRFRDPAGASGSAGIHESQSRFWENLIGRSRAFWTHYYQPLRQVFPGTLDDVSLEAFHGALNLVAPSLIRVEADEATYNLHILLRFDIESELIAGRVETRELPELWRVKMLEYLGIAPTEDRLGVLQDIHWSIGLFGYFPTYALGNLYGAQFLEQLRRELPDLDERVARGELLTVKNWLNRNIHVHGRRWSAQELCRKVTGGPVSAAPLLRHLQQKYAEIYGL